MSEITVTVVYALPEGARQIKVTLPVPATVADALEAARSGLAGFDTQGAPVGVFGKRVRRESLLEDGDRVEIYRPLLADPKELRRRRSKPRAKA